MVENINLEQYKVFYHVSKNKNITKTSQELMISQPAITQTIKKLENQMGYKLFFRTKSGVELTKEGRILFHEIKHAVECLEHCKNKLDYQKNKKPIVIRIGGGTTLLKHNALGGFKKFKKKYSHIKIEIKKDITKNLFYDLEHDKIDLIFFNMPITDINMEKIKIIPIEDIYDGFIADSATFAHLKDKVIKFKDLENLPLVLQTELSSSRKYLNYLCNKNKVKLNDSYDLSSYELVIEFVKAGLGLGFINKNHIKNQLKEGSLFEVKTDYTIKKRQVGIAINKKNENNKYLLEFIYMIKNTQ